MADSSQGIERVEFPYVYRHVNGAGACAIATGDGFLHAITVNASGAGPVTVWDNVSAATTQIAGLRAGIGEQTLTYDVRFTKGLTLCCASAVNMTVSYRA